MKLDAALPPVQLKEIPAIAKAAEATGFAALWTQETQHDPFLPLTLIAEHSSKMEMGTAIAVSFARSPANLAYTAWDLAAQSNGRFILGLGTQVKAHIERRFGMAWPESVTGKLRIWPFERAGAMVERARRSSPDRPARPQSCAMCHSGRSGALARPSA